MIAKKSSLFLILLIGSPSVWGESAGDEHGHHECEHDHGAEVVGEGHGGHDEGHVAGLAGSPHHPHLDLLEDVDDGWFHLHPHLSAAIALGGSSSEKNRGLLAGGHAPLDDGFNLQGIEFGALMELGSRFSLQGNYNVFWDKYDHWDGEWEEGFAAFDLTDDLTIRGGQFLVPFGYANTLHLHDREFVEPAMMVTRMLGEDGLYSQGGELAWRLPAWGKRAVFRLGYGKNRSHMHGSAREFRRELYEEALEGEEHEEDEEHGQDEDHDHDHEEEHGHGFAGGGGVYDAEEAYLDDGFFFARLESSVCEGHGLRRVGLSFAGGENGFKRTTWMVGMDLYGTFEIAERPAWWRAEAMYRYVDAYDRGGQPGHFDDSGVYLSSGYEFIDDWSVAGRVEWGSGDRMAGMERRWRLAGNLNHVIQLGSKADLHTRLQYTYDDLGGYGNDHSVWLQFVLNLGAAEHGHEH